jgi:integrase
VSSCDLVFPTGAGTIENLSNIVQRILEPTQIAAGVTVPVLDNSGKPKVDDDGKPIVAAKYGMHALRHFYASWCINRRADGGLELPAKTVQARLGHSTIVMTLDRYGHLFPSKDDGAELAAAERAIFAAAAT